MTDIKANTPVEKDRRVMIGCLVAPLIGIPLWKTGSVIAVPATYVAMVLFGLPLLAHLASKGRYQWWYALGVGWILGLLIAIIYLVSVDQFHALLNAPKGLVLFQGFGALLGLSFWALAVFRNARFPGSDRLWILAPVCAVAIFLATRALQDRFEVHEVFGQAVARATEGAVTLALPNGKRVEARPSWESLDLPETRPVGAYTRLAWSSDEELYWLNGMCKEGDGRVVPCRLDERYSPPPPPPRQVPQ